MSKQPFKEHNGFSRQSKLGSSQTKINNMFKLSNKEKSSSAVDRKNRNENSKKMYFKVNRNKVKSRKVNVEISSQYQFVCSGIIQNEKQTKKIASKETESKSDHNYSNKEPNNFNSNYSSVIIGVEDNVPKLDFNRLTCLKQRYSSNKIETKNNENGITKRSNTSKITHKRTSIIDSQGVKAIQPRKIDFNSYHFAR